MLLGGLGMEGSRSRSHGSKRSLTFLNGLREQSDQLVLLEAIASALAPALQVGQAGMLEPSASSTVLPAASSRAQFRSLNEVIQIY